MTNMLASSPRINMPKSSVKERGGSDQAFDENRAKSPVPSGKSRESTPRFSDMTGLFWLTRISSPRINMPKSSVEKRGGSDQAFV
jgi:hypothetical protein